MPDPNIPQERKVTVSFKKAFDYKIYSATDLFGGPTADGGKVFFHLAIDHFATPSYQTFVADEHGIINLANVKDTVSSGDLEKDLLCGILFTPEDSIKIGSWLIKQGEDIIKRRAS